MYAYLSLLSYGVNFNFPPCPKIEKIAGIDIFLVNFGHRVASSIGNMQFTHALIFQISNLGMANAFQKRLITDWQCYFPYHRSGDNSNFGLAGVGNRHVPIPTPLFV